MDKVGANFEECVTALKDKLGANGVAIQYPIGAENMFKGLIDLVEMKAYYYKDGDEKEIPEIKDIPADLQEKANHYRQILLDSVATFDDEICEKYLNGETLTIEEIKKCIRKGVISCELFPVICGSSFKHKGVAKMMDAVVDYLPSPIEVPAIKAKDGNGGEYIVKQADN